MFYDAAVATDEDVPPSIKAVLLVLGVEVGEPVELFVAADAFFACDGINVAFRAGFIASSKMKKKIIIIFRTKDFQKVELYSWSDHTCSDIRF